MRRAVIEARHITGTCKMCPVCGRYKDCAETICDLCDAQSEVENYGVMTEYFDTERSELDREGGVV